MIKRSSFLKKQTNLLQKCFIRSITGRCHGQETNIKEFYHVRYLSTLLYKWIQKIGFIQPGSTPFKDLAILAPKLADPPSWWKSNSTPPLNLALVYLIQIESYFVLYKDVCQMKYITQKPDLIMSTRLLLQLYHYILHSYIYW